MVPQMLEPYIIRNIFSLFLADAVVPKGYVTFQQEGVGEPDPRSQKLSFRDVTSPINPQDYTLDSSGGKGFNLLFV